MKPIQSLDELKKIAEYAEKRDPAEFFIMLNGGARSSKRIIYYPDTKTFDVLNEIDFSYQDDLTEEQLATETFIVEAIGKKALFQYQFSR